MTKNITHLFNQLAVAATTMVVMFINPGMGGAQISPQKTESQHDHLMVFLDSNRDGIIDPYEAFDRLLQLKTESGKLLTQQNLMAIVKDMEANQRIEVQEFLDAMDQDGDSIVHLEEIDVEMRGFAQLFDKNQDGILDVEEALKAEADLGNEMLLSAEELKNEVAQVFGAWDVNGDNVLVRDETSDDLAWEEIREADQDGNQKVTRDEFQTFLEADNMRASFDVVGHVAKMNGVINSDTPAKVIQLILEHPDVRTIVMENVPGSIDDEANLRAARYIRKFGFSTVIESNGSVASGGTDFFLAGQTRVVQAGGKLGIHSWGGPGIQGKDVPKDDPQHQLYLSYYKEMGIPAAFYWRTLEAAPVDDIHWMTEQEIKEFNVRSQPMIQSQPDVPQTPGKESAEAGNGPGTNRTAKQPSDQFESVAQDQAPPASKPYSLPPELVGEARMMMALLDQNSDGQLQASELQGEAQHLLREADENQDQIISARELVALTSAPATDVHSKLSSIDTFVNHNRIVQLPKGLHRGINAHFKRYTNVLAPNGGPIHFLAMDGWSDERILRVRKVLEHFLQDAPNRQWGQKTAIANEMANNHATMILLNHSRDMERVLPDIEQTNLQMQDLRANEAPFEGEEDYLQHRTRDAAYEEVFHLVHGSGIIFAMREFDREIRKRAQQATTSGIWDFDEPGMPGNHFEYIICVYDNYLDLWKTSPTLMEGRRIGNQPMGESFNGEYQANQRLATKTTDPGGFALVEKFNASHILYTAELPPNFSGTFSLSPIEKQRYSEKAKHLVNVNLRGSNACHLMGNQLNNRLVGNSGDNSIQGNGGDDALFGGAGVDTALYRGPRKQYTIRREEDLVEIIDATVNRDGHDILTGIEKLKFQDGVVEVRNLKTVSSTDESLSTSIK